MNKLFLTLLTCCAGTLAPAQTADEIIDNYFEVTGGYDAWGQLENTRIRAKINQGGMEIPLEIVRTNDGKFYTGFTVQGQKFHQNVFDGETLWSINMMTMKAEKGDDEALANRKLDANDFPSDLYNYKEKGYTAELLGNETIEGTESHKLKLTKEPKTIAGETTDDIIFYYFDMESGVLLMTESSVMQGPQKETIMQSTFSDYDEVNGLYFPFSMTRGIKGAGSQPLIIESIETNTEIDESIFKMPEPSGK